MGWFTPEMEMFGTSQREHDARYAYGREWLGIVKRLWTETKPFDYKCAWFEIHAGRGEPKPLQKPYPVLVNAGVSPAGIDFSARDCDFNFLTFDTIDTTAVAARLFQPGRIDTAVRTLSFIPSKFDSPNDHGS